MHNGIFSAAYGKLRSLTLTFKVILTILTQKCRELSCLVTLPRFGLELSNLHQTLILGYSRLVLKMGAIDLDYHIYFDLEYSEIWLVRPITQICTTYASWVSRGWLKNVENGDHWLWHSKSFGHFDSEFQETAFNAALVYWSGPTKECYTSQRALVVWLSKPP